MSSSDSNYLTLPLQQNINQLAMSRAQQAIEQTGRALPCTVVAVSGSLVTVKFEVQGIWTIPQLQLPKMESQWMRSPTQIGDTGMTIPADTFLGGISGLGSGIADLTKQYGNMSTLVWVPVAAVGFAANPDPNKAWVNGPNGALFSDDGLTVPIEADATLGKIGVGGRAAALNLAGRAATAHDDLQTLANNIISTTITKFSAALGAAASSTLTGGPAFSAIISASNFVTNISGVNPTIPTGSSIVRVAS